MKEIMDEQRSLSKFLKKTMAQLLLSISIFSFLFSYYHSLYSSVSLLDHYPRNLHHFSRLISSHAMNKSYVFLICNGLLVFLSKTSGLVRCSPGFDVNDLLQKRAYNRDICLQMYDDFFETKEAVSQLSAPPNVQEQINKEDNLDEEMKQVSIFIAEEDDDQEEQEEEEDEEEEMLSTEELNQKFEEFIRRMKEDIMINEARELVVFK